MNQIQRNYLKAKAMHEAICEECSHLMEPHRHLLDEGKISEYVDIDMQANEDMGETEAHNTLMEAKDALMKWGYEVAKSHPNYARNAADIDHVYEVAASRRMPSITEKYVTLCLQLTQD